MNNTKFLRQLVDRENYFLVGSKQKSEEELKDKNQLLEAVNKQLHQKLIETQGELKDLTQKVELLEKFQDNSLAILESKASTQAVRPWHHSKTPPQITWTPCCCYKLYIYFQNTHPLINDFDPELNGLSFSTPVPATLQHL